MSYRIAVKAECPLTADAAMLMAALSADLQLLTGSSGSASVSAEDFLPTGALFAVARNFGGEPVGCGGFRPLSPGTAELKRMYAKTKSAGVGAGLLTFLENAAAGMGYVALRLETRRVNERAVAFYLRNGYRPIPNYGVYENKPEAVCFEKRLSCAR